MRRLLAILCLLGTIGCAKNPQLAEVRKVQIPAWRSTFAKQGMAYPPTGLLIRVFKEERELELWAQSSGSKALKLLKTYKVTAASGEPGPKRKEGDRQVPEGFYRISELNPHSKYHLSMRVNYPNASDRILSDSKKPGGDIFIHGKAVSIGCVAIGDQGIEEVYALVEDVQKSQGLWPQVHIFPCRMEGQTWRKLTAEYRNNDALFAFWTNLKLGYDAFDKNHLMPKISVNKDGSYAVVEQKP